MVVGVGGWGVAVQSHPELTPAICRSRILTAVLEKGVIDAAQEEAAWKSMQVRSRRPQHRRDESLDH